MVPNQTVHEGFLPRSSPAKQDSGFYLWLSLPLVKTKRQTKRSQTKSFASLARPWPLLCYQKVADQKAKLLVQALDQRTTKEDDHRHRRYSNVVVYRGIAL